MMQGVIVTMPARTKRGLRALGEESGWAWIAFAMIVAAPGIIINPRAYAPMAVQNAFSLGLTIGWGCSLLGAGLAIVIGLAVIQPHIERIGLIWFMFAVICWWGGVTFIEFNTTRIAPSITYLSITIAAGARYRQLGRVLHAIEYAQYRARFHINGQAS